MKKRDKGLVELTRVCEEALVVSKRYSYLWDNEDIWKDQFQEKKIYLARGFIARDECFCICIERKGEEFVFNGNNFCYHGEEKGLGARDAALRIINNFGDYTSMSAGEIRKEFYCLLKKQLRKYLGKKRSGEYKVLDKLCRGEK